MLDGCKVLLRKDKMCILQEKVHRVFSGQGNTPICTFCCNLWISFVDFTFLGSREIKSKGTVPGLHEGPRNTCWLTELGQNLEHDFNPNSKLTGGQFCEFKYWNSWFYRQSETRFLPSVSGNFGGWGWERGQGMFILNSIPLWISTHSPPPASWRENPEGSPGVKHVH